MAVPERDTVYTTDGTNRSVYTRESSSTGWFVGIIVALALLAIGYLVFSANSGPTTTTTAPSVTAPAETTPMTETPAVTEPAPMTEAPAVTEPAPMTEAPAATEPAPATEAPATTEPAPATEAPASQ